MTNRARTRQRGSTMLEFALLTPVIAALIIGFAGVSITFVRAMQADQICQQVARMAAGGANFDQERVKAEIYNLYGGKTLQDRAGVLYVTHIVREASGGYRKDKVFQFGQVNRWPSAADLPESVISLELGEGAWVTEVWFDNDSLVSRITPRDLHSRSVL